ncbi:MULTISPECIES: hypothetical protein [unclassified Caballeronia]|uniref:hypothetical protein n=1 Tax=unclassified Caballeronia TaxID=2646786 RepID=UPI002028B024|nr:MULTISPECIES: hypothetical protein [unclassified Caballeronia]
MADGAIVGTIVGGLIGFLSSAGNDVLKNRRESRALAHSFRGAITSLIEIAEARKYDAVLQSHIQHIQAGNPKIVLRIRASRDYVEIYKRNVDKLGALKGDLPELIPAFYTYVNSLLEDVDCLARGDWDSEGDAFFLTAYMTMREMLQKVRDLAQAIRNEVDLRYPEKTWATRTAELISASRRPPE